MTEKELHKLRRQDLLELLLSQSKEAARLQTELERLERESEERESSYVRLKEKLDEKDRQLEKLKKRLDEKDARIEQLQGEGRQPFESISGSAASDASDLQEIRRLLEENDRKTMTALAQFKRDPGSNRDLAELLVKQYESSKEKVAQSDETILVLRQQLAEKDAAIDTLLRRLDQVQQVEINAMQNAWDDLRDDNARMLKMLQRMVNALGLARSDAGQTEG